MPFDSSVQHAGCFSAHNGINLLDCASTMSFSQRWNHGRCPVILRFIPSFVHRHFVIRRASLLGRGVNPLYCADLFTFTVPHFCNFGLCPQQSSLQATALDMTCCFGVDRLLPLQAQR